MSKDRNTLPAARPLWRVLLWDLWVVLRILVTALAVFVLTTAAFLIATPEFALSKAQADWVAAKLHEKNLWPEGLALSFGDFDLRITRPGPLTSVAALQKRVALVIKDFKLDYAGRAAQIHFNEISLAATGGWLGRGASVGLLSIEPLLLVEGDVAIDSTQFPEDNAPKKKSSFDLTHFLTQEILPKWQFEGSRVELNSIRVRTAPESELTTSLQITATAAEVKARIADFRMDHSPLRIAAKLNLVPMRGEVSLVDAKSTIWKLLADAQVRIDAKKQVALNAAAELYPSHEAKFQIGADFQGITGVKRATLDGSIAREKLSGRFSLKIGEIGKQLKALDMVNCALTASFANKVGALDCGPETVRLKIVEHRMFHDPALYVFAPRFEFKVTHLDFGDTKKADAALHLELEHEGILHGTSDVTAHYVGAPKQPAHYSAEASLDFAIDKFAKVVTLLRETEFSVPAPLNSLDGQLSTKLEAQFSQNGGVANFEARTQLDSAQQSVHLKLGGQTAIEHGPKGLTPKTQATLAVESLRLSAPRFDLRAPPRFVPDPRFGPLHEMAKSELEPGHDLLARNEKIVAGPRSDDVLHIPKKSDSPPMNFLLRIMTVKPQAIQITTNLTKAPIPVDLNLLYDGRKVVPASVKRSDEDRGLKSTIGSGTNTQAQGTVNPTTSGTVSGTTSSVGIPTTLAAGTKAPPAPVTGYILVGRTPVDLFRRNATVKDVRLDLLPSGENKISGDVNVTYLEYSIDVIVSGALNNPDVRFTSDPPLDDTQILSVLLFGRPLNELEDDQKSSVSNLNAAFADAALGISSLYLLASTPIESIGYDPERDLVLARLGLGGGATLELGGGSDSSAIGIKKRLSHNFTFSTDVESLGASGERTVSALVEWVKRF